jgi:hypothetical protein
MDRLPRISHFASARFLAAVALLAAAALAVPGCGGSDKQDKSKQAKTLDVNATASTFAGPAPLKVQYSAKPVRSDGDVKYRWAFDKGGPYSTEQNPTYTYTKPDFYAATLIATDSAGHTDPTTFVVRAYTKKEWASGTKARASSKGVEDAIERSQITYYTKYPESLPYNYKADRYRQFPYLRPLLKKMEREHPALKRKNDQLRKANATYQAEQKKKYLVERKKIEQQQKQEESKKK